MKKFTLFMLSTSLFLASSNLMSKDNVAELTQRMRDEYVTFRNKKDRTDNEKCKNVATSIFGFSSITEKDCPTLYKMVKDLSNEMNLPMPSINIFSGNLLNTATSLMVGMDFTANAMVPATAVIHKFGRIIIGERTLNGLNYAELQSVVGHELVHIYHYHILKRIGLGLGVNTLSNALFRNNLFNNYPNLFFAKYIVSQLFIKKQSRMQEKEADMASLKIVKNPDDLVNALYKLEEMQENTTNLLKLITDLMSSHPSNAERKKYLEAEAALLGYKKP